MVTLKSEVDIHRFSSATDLFQFAAHDFRERAIANINEKGLFSVVLSGGNTPKSFFDALVKYHAKDIPWDAIKFFFGDERYVPSNNSESNYHMADEHLFSKVPVRSDNIYRIPTELSDPQEAAHRYEKQLREIFHLNHESFPPFDLVYLGLGEDGHTASLMPSSDKVYEKHQLVAALFATEFNMYRITLTPAAINHAKNIIFLVTGENKASIVKKILDAKTSHDHYPAELIHCVNGKTMWYLDHAAASQLTREK